MTAAVIDFRTAAAARGVRLAPPPAAAGIRIGDQVQLPDGRVGLVLELRGVPWALDVMVQVAGEGLRHVCPVAGVEVLP